MTNREISSSATLRMPSTTDKVYTLTEAVGLVPEGSVLGVGGVMDQMVPVPFLLALAKAGVTDLHPVTVAAGLGLDILVANGNASQASTAIVSFEDFGMSGTFRKRVESGDLRFHEYSELTLINRLTASMHGVPFLPTRGALGTDVIAENPGALRLVDCPFTGETVLACAALAPDVSVIHVHRADRLGNAQLDGKHIWHDQVIARSAKKVLVTAEEIVSTDEIRKRPEATFLPSFVVDAVVESPYGAAPSSCVGRYGPDRRRYAEWMQACKVGPEAISGVIDAWLGAHAQTAADQNGIQQ